ncbi:S41 family peptidase [Candidatus Omnitrophota bacterium]
MKMRMMITVFLLCLLVICCKQGIVMSETAILTDGKVIMESEENEAVEVVDALADEEDEEEDEDLDESNSSGGISGNATEEIIVKQAIPFLFEVDPQMLQSKTKEDREFFNELPLYATALALIKQSYVEDVPIKDLIHASLKGACSSLDSFSEFLTEEEYAALKKGTKGKYGGVGLVVSIRKGELVVIAPLEGSPAYKAGITSGDVIIKIDDTFVTDIAFQEAINQLRGEEGSKVNLVLKRKGIRNFVVREIERELIEIESVKEIKFLPGNIAYLRVIEFDKKAPRLIRKQLKKVKKEKARGLILDLRNNPGGLLKAGTKIAHYFLNKDELIVYAKNRNGDEILRVVANGKKRCPDIPIIVLLNKGSASASEVIAAAIRDNDHGLIAGETSFGKGSIQMVVPFQDKTAIRLTTAMYYTPKGMRVDRQGIVPDIEVPLTYINKLDMQGDIESEEYLLNDNQIVTALNVVKGVLLSKEDGSVNEA